MLNDILAPIIGFSIGGACLLILGVVFKILTWMFP